MITIVLDESLRPEGAPASHVFDHETYTILIGRDPSCQVPIRPELTKLGRIHCQISRAASSVELVVDREHPVYSDGRRVIGRTPLPLRKDIRLIDPVSGPVIRIETEKSGDVPATERDALSDGGTVLDVIEKLKAQGRNIALAGCLAVLALGGYAGLDWWQTSQREQAQLARMQELAAHMADAEAQSVDWVSLQKQIKPSVYQVTKQSGGGKPQHQGTAWVYDGKRLATNAHVASLFDDPKLPGRIVLIPADPALEAVPVVGIDVHPAYLAYRKAVSVSSKADNLPPLAAIGSYDVAFLNVPEGSVLGPPLELVDPAAPLSAGQAVAYLGYPERCARHAEQLHIKTGVISGTSDFLGTAAGQELVYHTAPGAGGASGSPMFNNKGEVVAIFSGGEPASPVEAVAPAEAKEAEAKEAEAKTNERKAKGCGLSGASTLYAQNISLLREMESGVAKNKQAEREAQWQNSALYKLNQDRVWDTVAELTEKPASPDFAVQWQTTKLQHDSSKRSGFATAVKTFSGLEPGEYVAFANVAPEDRVTLAAFIGETAANVPLQVEGKPTMVFSLKTNSDVVVTLAGPNQRDVDIAIARLDTSGE
jgi:hypothetical protein